MTQPVWVVQNCRDSQTQKILEALKEAVEPFILACYSLHGLLEITPDIGTNLIPYGSTSLLAHAKEAKWRHAFTNDEFNVKTYLQRHEYMLNRDTIIMSLSAARLVLPTKPQWFIRPADDSKIFAGHTAPSDQSLIWIDRLMANDCYGIDGNTLVALSSPKVIDMEWRYFIVEGQIITGSSYRRSDSTFRYRETDPAVLREAQELANHWLPHECCVMDVALWKDKVHVVEFNELNSSGFYDHDVTALVRAVSEYARLRS